MGANLHLLHGENYRTRADIQPKLVELSIRNDIVDLIHQHRDTNGI